MRGKAPLAIAALLLAASACSPQCGAKAGPVAYSSATPPSASPTATTTTPLQASSDPFHSGEVGLGYGAVNLTATGGVAPYTWSVSSGQLPGGLALAGGAVSGTPTASGNFSFTIQVTDARDGTATLPGVISIAPALAASLIPACAQYCRVELGCVDVCGPFGQLSGGVGPFTYNLAQGQLPAGTSLSGLALTGKFVGLSGYLKFTVQVADALGATTTIAPTFWMYDHISVAGATTCYGNYITGCNAQLAITGGIPGTAVTVKLLAAAPNPNPNPPNNNPGQCWTPANSAPPARSSLTISAGNAAIYIPPAPEPNADGYGAIWTIQVVTGDPCATGQYCASNQATVVIGVQCG